MKYLTDNKVDAVISTYPDIVQVRYLEFKSLLIKVASDINGISNIEECVKWSQPSFKSTIGSPFRFGWSNKSPDTFGIYFICTTSLVETFKKLYLDFFHFDGNRGLIFNVNQTIETEPLDHCLALALTYKKVKDLPLLGA